MKYYYPFLAGLLLLVSCSRSDSKHKINFASIEITYGHHSKHQTVHIDSNRIITWCKYYQLGKLDSVVCYHDTLATVRMDTLIDLIEMVKKIKTDTINPFRRIKTENPPGNPLYRCGGYIVKIITPETSIKKIVIGHKNFQNYFKEKDFPYEIAILAKYISQISVKPNIVDSDYVFETEKSISPIIKEIQFYRPPNCPPIKRKNP